MPGQGEGEGAKEDTLFPPHAHLIGRLSSPAVLSGSQGEARGLCAFQELADDIPARRHLGRCLKSVPGAPSAGLPGLCTSALRSWEASRGLETRQPPPAFHICPFSRGLTSPATCSHHPLYSHDPHSPREPSWAITSFWSWPVHYITSILVPPLPGHLLALKKHNTLSCLAQSPPPCPSP